MTNKEMISNALTSSDLANDDIVTIQMFGDLILTCNDQILSGDKVRAKQVWTLLQYLLLHRHKEASVDKLIEILWEDESIDDPANALKNLAYRLRTTLKKYLGDKHDNYILNKHGAYVWNSDIPCQIDIDIFEQAVLKAREPNLDREVKRTLLTQAESVYNGELLPQAAYRPWVVSQSVYYNRLFMETVETLCLMLIEDGSFMAAEEVSSKAIAIDYFVEKNHELFLTALLLSSNHKRITEHYDQLCQRFYDDLGIRPSEAITALYQEAVNKEKTFQKDIAMVKNDLKESGNAWGAITCNYDVFKHIYQMQARASLRNGRPIFIALLTVENKYAVPIPQETLDNLQVTIVDCLSRSLRKDDVVTRYNREQYLLMLTNITHENTTMVLQRLIEKFASISSLKKLKVHCQVQALDPIEFGGGY